MARSTLFSSRFALAIALLFSVSLSLGLRPARAQYLYDGNNNLPPWGGFSGGDIDTVSLQNGNLHLHIPLGSWKQRGGKTIEYFFVYDTPTWTRVTTLTTISGQRYYNTGYNLPLDYWFLANNLNWSVGSSFYNTTCPGQPTVQTTVHSAYVLQDGENTKHPLDLQTDSGKCLGQTTQSPAMDGIGAMETLGSSLVFKDGTRFTTAPGLEDTNGNLLGNVDTLNRTLLTTTNGSTYTLYTITDTNGASQTFRVDYTTINVATNNCGVLNHPPQYNCNEVNTTLGVPSKLTLPDGQTYQFSWFQGTLGALQSITLPTGATISYTYTGGYCEHGPPSYGQNTTTVPYDCRDSVATRTVTVNGVNSQWTYTTGAPGAGSVTDPLGNQQVHTFSYVTASNQQSSGTVETQVSYYQGSSSTGKLLKTVTTDYAGEPDGFNGFVANIRPIRVTTTLDNGLVTKKETDYETFTFASGTATRLNPTEIREYDYGSGAPGPLLRRTDYTYLHNNNSTYLTLNIVDRPASVTAYDGSGTQVSQTTYEYDVYNHSGLPSMGSSGAVQHDSARGTTYTTRGNLTGISNWVNTGSTWLTSNNQFDDAGNIIATMDARGNVTNFDYTDSWANTSCAPSGGQGKAYVTKITNALNQVTKKSYNSCTGLMASVTDPNLQVTSWAYDLMNRPVSVNSPDGGLTTKCYTDLGGSTCTQAPPPYSVVTTKKMSSTTSLTSTTLLDGLGRVSETQLNSDPDCASGDKTDTTYDGLGRVYTVSNAYCTTSDPTYGLTTFAYDALGRTTQVTHPDNSTILTTYTGRATQVQDEGNGSQRVTRISQVDGFGRVASLCEVAPGPFVGAGGSSSSSLIGSAGTPAACGQDIAGTGFLTTYQYDTLDNLLQVNQSGIAARTFTYDSLSRLLTAFNPESGSISYSYDANGNLSTKTSPAPNQTGSATVVTSYSYDALNRLTQKSYNDTPQTPAVTFTYDQGNSNYKNLVGRLYQSAVGSNTYTLNGYDPMGRIVYQTQAIPNANNSSYSYPVPYTYDLMGNMTFGGTGQYGGTGGFTYAYNTAARLTGHAMGAYNTYTTDLSGVHYDAAGRITSDTLGNGETETWTYNNRGWSVSSASTLNGTNTYSYNITSFAPDGDVLAANDSVNGNWTYSYDPFNRLVGSNKNSGQAVYSYVCDRFGNRWQQNGPNSMQLTFTGNNPSSPQNNNRMDGYTYDAAGNLLNDGTHQYFFDAENHLIQVDGSSGYCSSGTGTAATACYFYDANGNRVRNTGVADCAGHSGLAGGMGYTYDLSGRWVTAVATDAANEGPCEYEVYAGGRHLFHSKSLNLYSHTDWLGTERARICAPSSSCGGYNQDLCTSLPFGDGLTCTFALNGAYLSHDHFTGKQRDTESGLDNFGARFDSSTIGRFMSPDPLGGLLLDPQTLNKYSYVRNNPVNLTDPTGLYVCRDDPSDGSSHCASDDDKRFEAARQHDLQSKNADVVNAAKAYGDQNSANGVTVGFADLGKNSEGGVTVSTLGVDDKGNLYAKSDVTINSSSRGTALDADVGHEGSHVEDAQTMAKSITYDKEQNIKVGDDISAYRSEQRAYAITDTIYRSANEAYHGCASDKCALGAGSSPLGIPGRIDQILLANPKIYHSSDGKPLTSTNQGGNILNLTIPH